MFRMVRLEVKRSIALPLFLVLAALTRVFLWMDIQQWAASWGWLVYSARGTAWVALPMVLAAGIWHGGRERRSEVSELFAATPRSRSIRLLPAFLVIAGTVALAEAAVVAWAGVLISHHATYSDGNWPLPLAVGVLAAVAVTLLGLGIGRVASTPVAAPLGAVVLFLILGMSQVRDGKPANRLVDTALPMLPQTDDFHRVLPSLSAAQGIWFAALGVTGVLLTVAATTRARALALTPAVAGIALGVLLAPSGAIVPDPGATALVCAPNDSRVCVTKVHTHALAGFVPPARKVLDAFAKVPGGPTRVEEDPVSSMSETSKPDADAKDLGTIREELPYLTQGGGIRWTPDEVLAGVAQDAVIDVDCFGDDPAEKEWTRAEAAADAVTTLLLGTRTEELNPAARKAYDTLRTLPAKERYQRMGDARKAGLTCGDPLAVVMGRGAGR